MNAFYEHHKDNIRFAYRCFDRILLHAAIQPFQQEQRAVGFFWSYRQIYPVSRPRLRDIATQYHNWVKNRSQKWGLPIQEDPPGRRDDFVARYFRRAQPDQVVAIIKAREPATIMTAIGKDDRWHLEMKRRWVEQYNFYNLTKAARIRARWCQLCRNAWSSITNCAVTGAPKLSEKGAARSNSSSLNVRTYRRHGLRQLGG
jgi:hypothetical protein